MKTTNKFSSYAMKKAYLAVSVFTIWAVFVAFKMGIHPYSASIWLFYLLLLLNTLFSIMTFATITPTNHFGQKTIFIQINNGDTLKYYPKYFGHPWIEDKLQVGDYFSKRKQTMNFTVIHKKGDTTFLNYKIPNCENACNTDKMLSDFKDSLDKTRK